MSKWAALPAAAALLCASGGALAQAPSTSAEAPASPGAAAEEETSSLGKAAEGAETSSLGMAAREGSSGEESETLRAEKREEVQSYRVSEKGRRYRVKFDPASRISLLAGTSVLHDGAGNAAVAFEAGFSLGYRKVYYYGTGEERRSWQFDHTLVSGWVRPFVRPAGELPSMDAALYRGTLLRHSADPSIVLPLSPPLTVGFPFDVGLDAEFGRVTVPAMAVVPAGMSTPVPWIHLGVVRASFTLDPWRPGQAGRALSLGVGVRYDVDVYGAPSLSQPVFVHRVAPLTSGSVRFRYQTDDGLLFMDLFGEAAPHWTSENQWAFLATGTARVDRTLIAVGDQPVSAFAEVGYRYLPEGAGAPSMHDVRGTLGVAMSLSLK
ncbi:MAG: hypothetical protein R3B70_17290 [Polyangiaceae bacterium]